jgi:hypothetical protein
VRRRSAGPQGSDQLTAAPGRGDQPVFYRSYETLMVGLSRSLWNPRSLPSRREKSLRVLARLMEDVADKLGAPSEARETAWRLLLEYRGGGRKVPPEIVAAAVKKAMDMHGLHVPPDEVARAAGVRRTRLLRALRRLSRRAPSYRSSGGYAEVAMGEATRILGALGAPSEAYPLAYRIARCIAATEHRGLADHAARLAAYLSLKLLNASVNKPAVEAAGGGVIKMQSFGGLGVAVLL